MYSSLHNVGSLITEAGWSNFSKSLKDGGSFLVQTLINLVPNKAKFLVKLLRKINSTFLPNYN